MNGSKQLAFAVTVGASGGLGLLIGLAFESANRLQGLYWFLLILGLLLLLFTPEFRTPRIERKMERRRKEAERSLREDYYWVCSNCKAQFANYSPESLRKNCPNCGAKWKAGL